MCARNLKDNQKYFFWLFSCTSCVPVAYLVAQPQLYVLCRVSFIRGRAKASFLFPVRWRWVWRHVTGSELRSPTYSRNNMLFFISQSQFLDLNLKILRRISVWLNLLNWILELCFSVFALNPFHFLRPTAN